jgi:integrase
MIVFDQQADWYEGHVMAQHKGAHQEGWKLRPLRRFFGDLPLDQVTPQRWQEYVTQRTLRDGVSKNTVGRELVIIKAVLQTAVGEALEYNPLATVKRTHVPLTAKRTVTAREEKALLAALKAGDAELHDLYVVAVGTLIRQRTLADLRRGAHRGDRLEVDGKAGPYTVPLTGPTELQRRAAHVLQRRMPKTADGYFFPKWHATFARYDNQAEKNRGGWLLRRAFSKATAQAGLPWGLKRDGINWHTATRASGATRMLREYKVDIRTIQLLGNWSSLDQLSEYLGIDLDLHGEQKWA